MLNSFPKADIYAIQNSETGIGEVEVKLFIVVIVNIFGNFKNVKEMCREVC